MSPEYRWHCRCGGRSTERKCDRCGKVLEVVPTGALAWRGSKVAVQCAASRCIASHGFLMAATHADLDARLSCERTGYSKRTRFLYAVAGEVTSRRHRAGMHGHPAAWEVAR